MGELGPWLSNCSGERAEGSVLGICSRLEDYM